MNDIDNKLAEQRRALDRLYYPDRRTLRNTLQVKEPEVLKALERNITAARTASIPFGGWEKASIGDELRAVHRFLFEDLYDWAGRFRTFEIIRPNKLFQLAGEDYISNFAETSQIGAQISYANHQQKKLDSLPLRERIPLLGQIHGILDYAHPFFEGNGRAIRALMDCLAFRNGIALTWPKEDELVAVLADTAQLNPEAAPEVWGEFYDVICTPLAAADEIDMLNGRSLIETAGLATVTPITALTSKRSDRSELQEQKEILTNTDRPRPHL